MRFIHYDEARKAAVEALGRWVESNPGIERVLLAVDQIGRAHV